MRWIFIFFISFVIISCSNDEKTFDAGYNDGYAEGYNTTCEIRATMVYGHWDSKDYSKGYNVGRIDGSQQCLADKRNGNVQ